MGNGIGFIPPPPYPGYNQDLKDNIDAVKHYPEPEHTHSLDRIERQATQAGRILFSFGIFIVLALAYVVYYSISHGANS